MNIITKNKKMVMKDVEWGCVFKYVNTYYMKTEYMYSKLRDEQSLVNCIDLISGQGVYITNDEYVEVVNKAKLKV